MKILVVSAIFPPDVGGPATHTAELQAELRRRGHDVDVLALTDESNPAPLEGVVRLPRSWPLPARMLRLLTWLVRHGRKYDAIYATGLGPVAVAAGRLIRRPVLLKIVGDPAWERGSRQGLTTQSFDDFQDADAAPAGRSLRMQRWLRDWSVKHATLVITPSAHLQQAAAGWSGRDDIVVVPNGARALSESTSDGAPSRPGLHVVFVGRLVPLKRVELLVEAAGLAPAISLEIIGEGPELESLETLARAALVPGNVHFVGALDHHAVMERIAAADVLALASNHEGLPHAVLEALVSGTPVVSTDAGGVMEVLHHGIDSLIVDPETGQGFANVFNRLADDPNLRARLRVGVLATGLEWRFESRVDTIEGLLREEVFGLPSVVFVGKSRTTLPLNPDQQAKYAIHRSHLRTTVVCTGPTRGIAHASGTRVVALPELRPAPLGMIAFYALAPVVALRSRGRTPRERGCVPEPVRGLRRARAPEAGSVPAAASRTDRAPRRLAHSGPVVRKLEASTPRPLERSHRRVGAPTRPDRVRPVSQRLADLAREYGYEGPLDRFITFSDFSAFLDGAPTEPPSEPRVLFAGVLERYKAVDVLIDAWADVARRMPKARLTLVGSGRDETELRARAIRKGVDNSVVFVSHVPRSELSTLLDGSTCFVLPSRSEGLARVALEAMARGRPVVASDVGGIRELVEDGVNGRVVDCEDARGLADALVDVLSDPERARAMGVESRRRALERDPLREYESGIVRLATWISAPNSARSSDEPLPAARA